MEIKFIIYLIRQDTLIFNFD